MGRYQPLDPYFLEIMKATPPKNIIITHATINHTHHGIPDVEAATGTGVGEPEVAVAEAGIFEPPEESWIIFPGSFLYENIDAPEESV